MAVQIETLTGEKQELADAAVEDIRETFRGAVLTSGDGEYDAARVVVTASPAHASPMTV